MMDVYQKVTERPFGYTVLDLQLYSATFFSFSISVVVTGAFCALTNLPQLHKESTTCKLCHMDAVTVKSHLLVLVVEDITRGILVESDLKTVKTNSIW